MIAKPELVNSISNANMSDKHNFLFCVYKLTEKSDFLQGGLNEEGEIASVALTAYVITALIDNTTPVSYRVIRNTLSCLRALPALKSPSPTRVYAHALLAYAFMKIEKYEEDLRKTNNVNLMRSNLEQNDGVKYVLELLKVARRSGDYVWWEASK